MIVDAVFVRSAAGAGDFPPDGLPEIALVGRSNVGKSSLINALARRRVARISAAPGKTRLANVYRIARGSSAPLYLIDLPGYGYARGGATAARAFDELTRAYFGRTGQAWQRGRSGQARRAGQVGTTREPASAVQPALPALPAPVIAALLLVDARHPGLDSDRLAWTWLLDGVVERAIVATKIDKLARGERIRARRELESVFEHPVLPVSAVTGEGLETLWKLIDNLANSRNRPSPRNNRQKEMAPPGPAAKLKARSTEAPKK